MVASFRVIASFTVRVINGIWGQYNVYMKGQVVAVCMHAKRAAMVSESLSSSDTL